MLNNQNAGTSSGCSGSDALCFDESPRHFDLKVTSKVCSVKLRYQSVPDLACVADIV